MATTIKAGFLLSFQYTNLSVAFWGNGRHEKVILIVDSSSVVWGFVLVLGWVGMICSKSLCLSNKKALGGASTARIRPAHMLRAMESPTQANQRPANRRRAWAGWTRLTLHLVANGPHFHRRIASRLQEAY